MKGFFLGLASGITCLTYCAPVLVPFLLGEGRKITANYGLLGRFLAGRLIGYLLFGVLAWFTGSLLLNNCAQQSIVGLAYIILAVLMAYYGFCTPPEVCAGKLIKKEKPRFIEKWPALLPVLLGLTTGINICPPFLLAFTEAVNAGSLAGSMVFFLAFFLGTALYFIPIPFLGVFRRFSALQNVGRLACVVMAVYYIYSGIIMLGGGV